MIYNSRIIVSIKKIVLFLSGLFIAGVIALVFSYFYIDSQAAKPFNNFGIYENFKIDSGESIGRISENLVSAGLIGDPFYFKFYLWKKGQGGAVKAGEYRLSSSMSVAQIAEMFIEGKIIDDEITVLIPEGLTSGEIEKILIDSKLLKKGEFVDAVKNENIIKNYSQFGFLRDKPENGNLEGFLFPDTYKFFKDATPEEIVKKMLSNFDKKIDLEMREEIARQGKTIFEVLTLASIVQEEANGANDMKIIAGIFINRLKIGKALEADSTINFITGKKMSQALYSDLENSSLYNTYKNIGLPPGPIDNPGLDALRAVIWPRETAYLYFLHAPDGKAYYGKTYQEHLRNRVKYLN